MTPTRKHPQKSTFYHRTAFLLVGVAVALLIGCSQAEPIEQPPIENISVPTPTPPPTATPFAETNTDAEQAADNQPSQSDGSSTEEEDGGGLLSGFLNEEEEESVSTPIEEESPPEGSDPAPESASVGLEPAEVTIDLQSGELNTWIEVDPPPGWRITQGLDGLVLAKEPDLIPNSSFVMVRRWGNVVNLEDYVAYLPDAVEEPNSTVAFKLGGYDWEGVFVTNETNSYRAFFGVSNDVLPSFSLLVFVPGPEPLPEEDAISRETLLEVWTFDVGDLNSILRRMAFY